MTSNAHGWQPDLPITPDPSLRVQRIVIVHGAPDPHLAAILAGSGLEIAVTTATSTIWTPSTIAGLVASCHRPSPGRRSAPPVESQGPAPLGHGLDEEES